MSKRCDYKNCGCVYQHWPQDGPLKKNMNKTLQDLTNIFKERKGSVYAYILTTVKSDGHGGFIQIGSAPNFQGGLITLCTCKHYMRTWRETYDWKGIWIAGFTGINILGHHRNYLFYLMQIQDAFPSHKNLWDWLDPNVKNMKDASSNKLGDVYKPKSDLTDPFDPDHYCRPIKGHSHFKNNEWFNDISYKNSRTGRPSALLVGDPKYSFLWSQPNIYFKDKHPRTKCWDLEEFIKSLR